MANTLNITIGLTGQVNGENINQNNFVTKTPTGSVVSNTTLYVQTSSWQSVFTNSFAGQPIGTVAVTNLSTSGSIMISTSSLGTPVWSTIGPSCASSIEWNNILSSLYAQANVSGSYGNFVIVAA